MTVPVVLDSAGRRRSPATMPGYHTGATRHLTRALRYPADPPTVEEIVAVMRLAGEDRHGWRLRATIVVLWRGLETVGGDSVRRGSQSHPFRSGFVEPSEHAYGSR